MTKSKPIISYKGFTKNLKCRDFQYKIGKTYTYTSDVKACQSGFHACEYPLDVFNYYSPAESVFCQVEQSGQLSRHNDDSKVSSSSIKIVRNLSISDMVKSSIDFTMSRLKKTTKKSATNTGNYSAATNTGNYSAATNTGDRSAATNTGYRSVATVEGDCVKSIAAGFGYQNKAKASLGNWIVLAHRNDDGEITHIKSAKVGKKIKPDTFYILDANGKFQEVK